MRKGITLKRVGLTIEERAFRAPFDTHTLTQDTKVISREGWYQVITPSVPDANRNEVIWAQFSEDAAENEIDKTITDYTSRGLPFKWCMNPFSKPAGLSQRLAKRGYPHWDCRAMWIDLANAQVPIPEGITIEALELGLNDEEYLHTFTQGWNPELVDDLVVRRRRRETMEWTLSQPNQKYRFFIARYDGKPVGTAGYILKSDCAYFIGGNVLPEMRGKGVYRALISARISELLERGVTLVVTHAREATSAPILEKLGWQTAYRYPIYLIEPKA